MKVTQFNKILIVEDDLTLLNDLKEIFSTYFHEVVAACDGASAYVAIQNEQFDLILTDICMDGFNGIELITRLRADGKSVPIIMTSGMADPQHLIKAMKLGVRDFVQKPYTIESLLATVYGVIEVQKRESKLHQLQNNLNVDDEQVRKQERMIGLLQAAHAAKKSA